MNTTEKVINLFQYIREVYASEYNVITDIKKEKWHQFLDEIPIHTQYIKCPFLDTSNTDDIEKNVILEVVKPELDPCPEIPAYLEIWLSTDWKVASNQLTFKEKIVKDGKTITFEEFFGNAGYQKELYDWMQKRANWVKELPKQKRPEKIDKFFRSLWNQYELLNQNIQSLELMIGQGILEQQQNDDSIFYPVLLKKVFMTFDTESNIIRIIDTDTKPQLNTELLKKLENVDEETIKTAIEDLDKNNYQPLDKANTRYFLEDCHKLFDGADTDDFLEKLAKQIGLSSAYYKDIKQIVNVENKMILYSRPVLFIRGIESNILQPLDMIIDEMKQTGKVSSNLLNLMEENVTSLELETEKPTLPELKGESETILFSKKANKEQLDIAKNMEQNDTILVQSPPGTGKANTIVNLMGHFLAQGKSVLITSPIQKTLLEVRQKIVKELQDLCVSNLENDVTEIERCIDTIIKFSSKNTSEDMLEEEGMLQRRRKEILHRLSEIRNEMYNIQQREYETITLGGENYTVKEVADFVCENREELSYIPGKITLNKPLPVSKKALEFLYQTNAAVTQKQELELEFRLPEPRDIMSPEVFESVITERNGYTAELLQLKSRVRDRISIDFEHNTAHINNDTLYTNLDVEKIKQIKKIFSDNERKKYSQWQLSAVFAGKKKDNSERKWRDLIEAIEDAYEYHDYSVEKTLRKDVDIPEEYVSYRSLEILQKLQGMLKKGKKIGGLSFLIHKDWKELYETLEVNGKQISKADDCEVLIATIYMDLKRNEIEKLWIDLIEEEGGEFFYTLGMEPELKGIGVVEKIEECLNWYQTVYQPIKNVALECGLSPACFDITDEVKSSIEEAKYDMDLIYKFLPQYVSIVELLGIKLSNRVSAVDETMELLQSEKFAKSSICNAMLSALQEKDMEKYRKHYEELLVAYNKFDDFERRGRILEKIVVDAPEWATAIQYRTGIHGASECPENIEGAWNWKQLSTMLDDIIKQPFAQLQKEESNLSTELRDITIKLIQSKAWYPVLLHMEKDKKQKQYLQQWKQNITSLANKEETKKSIIQCQHIIPAWIMSTNQVLNKLNVKENKFDVAIVSEANQCDISTLIMFCIAKKLIIIGDNEQIRLCNNDKSVVESEKLLHFYGKGEFPNEYIYNIKYSLYDIAKTTFKTLMLKEHFKCVPDIIGYNNRLCYNNKLKPLRDYYNIHTKPYIVPYYVKGECDNKRKNIQEAKNIVALMIACMEQPEYKDMTFGAISLLGREQANIIRQIAFQKISPKEYKKRKVLCEDVCCFQNDERDVIFISTVDSCNREGFTVLYKNDTEKSTRQMYNVAVSRARNQLWIVHSFNVKQDLEIEDVRRNLIEYAENLGSSNNNVKQISSFEASVANALMKRGYHILKKLMVGDNNVDLAVIYGDKKVVIECDGEEKNKENILFNMKKQAVLERIGWNFIHIRSSEYFNDPEEAIKCIVENLAVFGVIAEQNNTNEVIQDNILLQKIQKRASHIVHEWEKESIDIQ